MQNHKPCGSWLQRYLMLVLSFFDSVKLVENWITLVGA